MKIKKLFFSILAVGILCLTSFSNASTNYYLSDQGLGFCFRLNDSGDCLNYYDGSLENITNGVYTVYYMAPRGYNQGADKDITYFSMNSTFAYVSSRGDMFFDEGGVLSCSDGTLIYQTSYSNQNPGPVYIQDGSFSLSGPINYSNVIFSCKGNLTVDTSNLGFIDSFMFFDLLSFADWDIKSLSILNQSNYSGYLTSQSNLNQCLEDKNLLIGQVSTLSGNLTSCQSDLSSCLNGVDVSYQACIENLSGCQSDLTNMTNYNDSLNSQLNECLAELPVPCEGTGCEETIITDQRFSFFRENDGERFSLPVANNVFLPQGYRAYVDSGVVAIGRLQDKPKISVDPETFGEVNTLYFSFFKYIVIVLLLALFLWFIKSLIYPLFIPKEK